MRSGVGYTTGADQADASKSKYSNANMSNVVLTAQVGTQTNAAEYSGVIFSNFNNQNRCRRNQ